MKKINVRSPYYIEVNEVQKPALYYALQKCSDSTTGYVSEQEVGDFSPTLNNNDRPLGPGVMDKILGTPIWQISEARIHESREAQTPKKSHKMDTRNYGWR